MDNCVDSFIKYKNISVHISPRFDILSGGQSNTIALMKNSKIIGLGGNRTHIEI